jgi:hypothetical protein
MSDTDRAREIVDRTIERLKALHPYAARPAWDQVIKDEMLAALTEARQAGARDMRERAAKVAEAAVTKPFVVCERVAAEIRSLPIDEDKP